MLSAKGSKTISKFRQASCLFAPSIEPPLDPSVIISCALCKRLYILLVTLSAAKGLISKILRFAQNDRFIIISACTAPKIILIISHSRGAEKDQLFLFRIGGIYGENAFHFRIGPWVFPLHHVCAFIPEEEGVSGIEQAILPNIVEDV